MFNVRFLAGDPRAGRTAQMDSSRGQQLIDSGAAERLTEQEFADVMAARSAAPEEPAVLARAEDRDAAATKGAPRRQAKPAAPNTKGDA